MGGAQPLAVKMLGGVALIADVDGRTIERGLRTGHLDSWTDDLDGAIDAALRAKERREAVSIGVLANVVDLHEKLVKEGVTPDPVADQTPAHDPLPYVPQGLAVEAAERLGPEDPERYIQLSRRSMARRMELLLAHRARGAAVFEYGNDLRKQAHDAGVEGAFKVPGQMEYLRPAFEEGRGPFRWTSLVGEPNIYANRTSCC